MLQGFGRGIPFLDTFYHFFGPLNVTSPDRGHHHHTCLLNQFWDLTKFSFTVELMLNKSVRKFSINSYLFATIYLKTLYYIFTSI